VTKIEIRPASAEDVERLAELRWEFRAGRAPATEGRDAFVARCAAWMRAALTDGRRWRAWAATTEGTIVGQVWVQTIEKMPNPTTELERLAYVSNLFVQPSFRGGTGARLLEAAVAWARLNECDRAVLWPSARSVTLYERHGFTHRGDVMELAVRRGAPGPRRR
jgi:GNAT superfamily N-acetyltransferase